jgi:hypothetical protein
LGVAHASGSSDDHLQAASVEDHALSPVDRPSVSRRNPPLQGPDDKLALELEVVTPGLGQELPWAKQEVRQTVGGDFEGSLLHARSLPEG